MRKTLHLLDIACSCTCIAIRIGFAAFERNIYARWFNLIAYNWRIASQVCIVLHKYLLSALWQHSQAAVIHIAHVLSANSSWACFNNSYSQYVRGEIYKSLWKSALKQEMLSNIASCNKRANSIHLPKCYSVIIHSYQL